MTVFLRTERSLQFLGKVNGVSEISLKMSKVLSEALLRSVRQEGIERKKEADTVKLAKAVNVSISAEAKQKLLKKL